MNNVIKKWKCSLCGYIHEGNNPPDSCPACGVGPDQFEKIVEESPSLKYVKTEKFLIIGSGIAGFNAAKAIRKRNKFCSINIVSGENYPTYYRPQLSDYLYNKIPGEKFFVTSKDWYIENNINIIFDYVTAIDTISKKVYFESSNYECYDKLILATEDNNFLSSLEDINENSVFTLINIEDVNLIKNLLKNAIQQDLIQMKKIAKI